MENKREGFGSKLGIIAAAAGSAIGLGNIWKFPYIVGENGGGAFLFVYLICIALIGMPIMLSEFIIGRRAQSNAISSFKKLKSGKPWWLIGLSGVLCAFMILSFYQVIAGWVFAYVARSITGSLINIPTDQIEGFFVTLTSSVSEPIFWAFIVMAITAFIVIGGIQKGIEKYSKILMPVLLVLLIILMIRSLTLPGAEKGLDFLFKPDFSKLTTESILSALGHAFFSLSLGMGTMITYGSYINKKENLPKIAFQVSLTDTLIALMAGVVIFPAVFAFGVEPTKGPSLLFITLPPVFESMPLGWLFEALFFILVGIAAITSTISILEIIVAYFTETYNFSRTKTAIIVALICFIVGIPSSLSFGTMRAVTFFGRTYFEWFDYIASNILLPVGGLFISLFVGWVMNPKDVEDEITNGGTVKFRLIKVFFFATRYLAPIGIVIVLLQATGIIKLGQ